MKTAITLYFELTELIGHETKLNQKDCIALIESYAKEVAGKAWIQSQKKMHEPLIERGFTAWYNEFIINK